MIALSVIASITTGRSNTFGILLQINKFISNFKATIKILIQTIFTFIVGMSLFSSFFLLLILIFNTSPPTSTAKIGNTCFHLQMSHLLFTIFLFFLMVFHCIYSYHFFSGHFFSVVILLVTLGIMLSVFIINLPQSVRPMPKLLEMVSRIKNFN